MPRGVPLVVLACALALQLAGAAGATTYYVDVAGDDGNSGHSPSAPWQTMSRVLRADLAPGDRVLFRGGATWIETLAPKVSGRRSAPISFASYGGGTAALNGGIFLEDVSWLAFERLAISGTSQAVLGSRSGRGSRNISLESLAISDVGIGVNSANPRDRGWRIARSTIERTQDSAIIVRGRGARIESNRIFGAGLAADIPYAKHGIYLKGPRGRVSRNTIERASDAGITTRFPWAIIQWNAISDAETGISYFQDAAAKGRSILRHNTIENVRDGIFLSSSSSERFYVHGNTISARRNGLHAKKVRGLWVWDNAIKAGDRVQLDGSRARRSPPGYVDPSVSRLTTLRSFGLAYASGGGTPRLLAHIGCRAVATKRCRVTVSATVRGKRIANGTATIRPGGSKRMLMGIRRSAVRDSAAAGRPTSVSVLWTARDSRGRETIENAILRVRL